MKRHLTECLLNYLSYTKVSYVGAESAAERIAGHRSFARVAFTVEPRKQGPAFNGFFFLGHKAFHFEIL